MINSNEPSQAFPKENAAGIESLSADERPMGEGPSSAIGAAQGEDAVPANPEEQEAAFGFIPAPDWEAPLDAFNLWQEDTGTLTKEARSCLLALVKGPFISARTSPAHWKALLNNAPAIGSRLNDMFLELVVDSELEVAFARNVVSEESEFPKAASSYTLTMLDTLMLLMLRRDLSLSPTETVIVGQAELFLSMAPYRPLAEVDQAGYQKKLKTSWNRLLDWRLLIKTDVESRCIVSPVLKLVFGVEEVRAVAAEFEQMLQAKHAEGVEASAGKKRKKKMARPGNSKDAIEVLPEKGLFDGLE